MRVICSLHEEEVLMTHDHEQLITELGMAAYRNDIDAARQHYTTLIRAHQRINQELLHIVRNAIIGRGGSEADYRAFAAELEIALLH